MNLDRRFWNPQEKQLVYAVETRNHKGSKEPFSSLSADDETGATYYIRKLKHDREEDFDKLVPFIVDHLVRRAPEYRWRSDKDTYAKLAKAAIRRFLGEKYTQKQIAQDMGVSIDAVRCHDDKIHEAFIYLMMMYRA